MDRRHFLSLAGAAFVERGGWRLTVDREGRIVSLRRGSLALVSGAPLSARVTGPARLSTSTSLVDVTGGRVALVQKVSVAAAPGSGPVRVDLPRLRLPGAATAFAPMQNGVARRAPAPFTAVYQFAGAHAVADPQRLAIPMLSEAAAGLRLTHATDPAFTAAFADTIHWIYPDTAPLPQGETRTVYTVLHSGDERSALDAFYDTALAAIPAGPDWQHEIAMVGYDFLSEHGRGWYADIDALEQLIDKRDRPKVVLALHGWYDYCGRYTFNRRTQSLDRKWLAFPNAQGPEVQQRAERPDTGNPFYWAPSAIRALRPVEMSVEEVRRRLRYARSRGFPAALYFADGLNACDGIEGFDPSLVLRWGGWAGPETRGKSYAMNPLHPDVRRFFPLYLKALLAEYGRDIDALVWDETFYVQGDDLGAGSHRGWAGRAMMQLTAELTSFTSAFSKHIAFLASDDLGMGPRYQAPYALMAHGTYQDSGCAPKGWPWSLFPNFRNTIWSCNWAPTKAFDRSLYAAETFEIPVAISNGYGEDRGMSELPPADRAKLIGLFEQRKRSRMEIAWIEERNGAFTYKGRPVRAF